MPFSAASAGTSSAWLLGSFHVLSDDWDLMADIGWEEWSRFGMVEILLASDDATSITADRNYEDVWHAAIGARKRLTSPWELRFGLAYDTSMVEDVDRTPDLPLGASLRLAGGAEYRYSEKGAFAFGYEVAWGGATGSRHTNPDHLRSRAELYAAGKALRTTCPREAHAAWKPPAKRWDAVELVLAAAIASLTFLLWLRAELRAREVAI